MKIVALDGPCGLPDSDELSAIAMALEALGEDPPSETVSRWRLAGRDYEDADFEFDLRRARR